MTGAVVFLVFTLSAHATDWYKFSPDEFSRQPAALARIDPAQFDRGLMVAAIFHETNRVRHQLGLPAFTHLGALDAAADLKATVGVLEMELKHENALPLTATPARRVESVGLEFSVVAENLARISSYDLDGSTVVGVRRRNGLDEFYDLDTGRPPEMQTYAGFATAVVAAWMKSPGHRANVVSPRLVSLGCAARPCYGPISRQEQIYAVQVFFTPLHRSLDSGLAR